MRAEVRVLVEFDPMIESAAPNLLAWVEGDREDSQRGYIRQQLRVLQTGAHINLIDDYSIFTTNDKTILDPRGCSVSCFAAKGAEIKSVTTMRSGKMHIWFGENCKVKNLLLNSDLVRCRIVIGPNTEISDTVIQCGPGAASVIIGSGATMSKANFLVTEAAGSILIGDDAMFSTEVGARTSDSHGIYSITSRQLINPGRPIVLHNHVWVGRGATLSKGAEVGPDTVLGAGSLVGKYLPGQRVYIGQPAREQANNTTWDRTQAATLDDALNVHPSRTRQWAHIKFCSRLDAMRDETLMGLPPISALSRILASQYPAGTVKEYSASIAQAEPEFSQFCMEAHRAVEAARERLRAVHRDASVVS